MSRRRDRATRAVTGAAVVGLVGAVAVLGSTPAATASLDARAVPAASEVRVPAGDRTLVCPGPLAVPDDAAAGDAAFDPTPGPTVTTQRVAVVPADATGGTAGGGGGGTGGGTDGTAGEVAGEVGAAALTPIGGGRPLATLEAGSGARVAGAPSIASATVLGVEPAGGQAPTAGGASASVTAAGDLRGLAAASCQPPSASIWLLGGSTEIGSSALLVVANPGRTPAEVTVEVFGPSGPVPTPGATFLVAPGAERALVLEGVAAEQRRLAVHVTAAGGVVAATVQDSRLDGFTPAGVDLVTAGAGPATRQVVPGVVVPATEVGQADAAQLRLLAPGGERATVDLTLVGPDGPVTLPGAERVRLGPGEVTDVSLAGLPAGAYTAVVDSGVPVLAGAMLTRPGPPVELGDLPTRERAWVAAVEPGSGGVVGVPDGVTGMVATIGAVPPPGTGAGTRAGTGAGTEAASDAGAAAGTGTASDAGAAAGTGGAGVTGTLRVLGTGGEVLAEQALSLDAGSGAVVDVARLAAGRPVGAVVVQPAGVTDPSTDSASDAASGPADDADDRADDAGAPRAALAWALVVSVGGAADELLSVLTPVPPPAVRGPVEVREAATLGLR